MTTAVEDLERAVAYIGESQGVEPLRDIFVCYSTRLFMHELSEARAAVDAIDDQLVDLLAERSRVSARIARVKEAALQPNVLRSTQDVRDVVRNGLREIKLLERVTRRSKARGSLYTRDRMHEVFNAVLRGSRETQEAILSGRLKPAEDEGNA